MAAETMPADVQAIALRKLADNGYDKTADLCEKRVAESPYGPVRLEALRLMSTSRSPRFNAMLVQAAGDSYELVRRLVSQWIGDCGRRRAGSRSRRDAAGRRTLAARGLPCR